MSQWYYAVDGIRHRTSDGVDVFAALQLQVVVFL